MHKKYLSTGRSSSSPSDSLEKLLTLQKIRSEMMQCFSQLVFCSGGFLVAAKASAKDLLDVPKEQE
jgi:hypothetical protein